MDWPYKHLPGFVDDEPTEPGYYWAVARYCAHKIGEPHIMEVVELVEWGEEELIVERPGEELQLQLAEFVWGPRVSAPDAPLLWYIDNRGDE